MSTAVEPVSEQQPPSSDYTKPIGDNSNPDHQSSHRGDDPSSSSKTQQHPLHQYDLTKMSKFYESCVSKFAEQCPRFKPTEWPSASPMPTHLSADEQSRYPNPLILSEKQRVLDCFVKMAREHGEPMLLMPAFDLTDLLNFDTFLDALKHDGVNAIRKYKQYLSNRDMHKQEVDLVCVHARYGIILVEVRESDYVDYRRRSRAKSVVSEAKSLLRSLGRLIAESKGLSSVAVESTVPVLEFIALPNVKERPQTSQTPKPTESTTSTTTQTSEMISRPTASTSTVLRQLGYLIKSDLESSAAFSQWWTKNVVEPREEQERVSVEQNKVNHKFDHTLLSSLVSLISCIRSNSILPVVYPESGDSSVPVVPEKKEEECEKQAWSGEKSAEKSPEEKEKPSEQLQFQPALNIRAEFFRAKHEESRSLSKCLVISRDSERIRKTICLQTMWLLLNDSQKKISVVCSELNKPFYEEFFGRQRKIYNNLSNLRLYTDLHSCDVSGQHTLKKEGEVWFFDSSLNGTLSDVFERVKFINSFWVFSEQCEQAYQLQAQLSELNASLVDLDDEKKPSESCSTSSSSSLLEESSIKLPLRLQCDLLIIGDMISTNQMELLYKFLQSKSVLSQASHYQSGSSQQSGYSHQQQQPPHHMLNFNPAKKFRSVKFIRGGSIDNIRNSLKMHDSIQSQVVLLHVGDEDLFKVRSSGTTLERVKELATLVKEYCPKSFVVLSTLMRRMSRTENGIANEVNKGIVQFCKQSRDTLNCYYMLNNHFDPDYHTQGGRLLNNKGLKLYVDNILFVVDYFLIKNNKQH